MKKWNDPNLDKLSGTESSRRCKGCNAKQHIKSFGTRRQVLVDRTQVLAQSAEQFHKRAKKLNGTCGAKHENVVSFIFGS